MSIERTECGDLLRRKWLNATLRRIILPEPVILTRFAIALCVFSFCFMTLLSVFLFERGKAYYLTCSDKGIQPISFSRFCNSVCLRVKHTDERGSLGDDCLIALQHNPPQVLHRRRREAYFRSQPRMPGEYSTPGRILQLEFLAEIASQRELCP